MSDKFDELKNRLNEIYTLNSAQRVLSWERNTYMPPGGSDIRAAQLALLARLSQERFADPALGKLLDELHSYEQNLPYDSDDASLVRVTRREYERMHTIPPEFLGEFNGHISQTFQVWTTARPENDFSKVRPYLEKTLDYSRRMAEYFPDFDHIADPLIGFSDPGVKAADLKILFASLRKELVPLVQKITSQPLADESIFYGNFDESTQWRFSEDVARQVGYDFRRGRLDTTYHPFTTRFSSGDVRITTRVKTNDVLYCLFGVLHEGGHALYDQGINPAYDGTPLADGASSGVHESQSRLWENIVGRSLSFWKYYLPRLQQAFPQLGPVTLEQFYRGLNKVERTLIRTDADEVTYNLHVMLRFDLELDLLEGKVEIRDLPSVWRERYSQDIGIQPPDDRDGVMQDAHWFDGPIGGAFQGYTIGNILSAQFYEAALKQFPQIPAEIEQGKFSTLLGWLQENIYQHGAKFTTDELVRRVTGSPLRIEPFINYLKSKYGALYTL